MSRERQLCVFSCESTAHSFVLLLFAETQLWFSTTFTSYLNVQNSCLGLCTLSKNRSVWCSLLSCRFDTNRLDASTKSPHTQHTWCIVSCHILLLQPFEARKDWFYENLYPEDMNSEMIHVPTNEADILLIQRGWCLWCCPTSVNHIRTFKEFLWFVLLLFHCLSSARFKYKGSVHLSVWLNCVFQPCLQITSSTPAVVRSSRLTLKG